MPHVHAPFDPAADGWVPLDTAGFGTLVGPFWAKQAESGLLIGLLTDERHANRNGTVHGGVLLSLADQGFAAAATQTGQPRATIQLNLQFMRSVKPGSFVIARGVLERQTRSMSFMRGELLVDGEAVASGTGVWKLFGASPAS